MTVATNTDSLYKKSNFKRITEFGQLAPEAFNSFFEFNNKALAEGKLSVKLKELIAIAVAHVTGCPYCIDLHVKEGKKQNATKEEIGEAIFVATALKAGSALAHGVNALNSFDGQKDDELYKASYFNRLGEFSKLNGDVFKAFIDFDPTGAESRIIECQRKRVNCSCCRARNRLSLLHRPTYESGEKS